MRIFYSHKGLTLLGVIPKGIDNAERVFRLVKESCTVTGDK